MSTDLRNATESQAFEDAGTEGRFKIILEAIKPEDVRCTYTGKVEMCLSGYSKEELDKARQIAKLKKLALSPRVVATLVEDDYIGIDTKTRSYLLFFKESL
jgi:hypothetical protein